LKVHKKFYKIVNFAIVTVHFIGRYPIGRWIVLIFTVISVKNRLRITPIMIIGTRLVGLGLKDTGDCIFLLYSL